MAPKLDLSKFRGDDSDDESAPFSAKKRLELNALKSKTFAVGNTKKTKKDLEREAEEKRKRDEEEEQRRVMAEFEADFARPSGPMSSRGRFVPGGGFVRAGGAPPEPPQSKPSIPTGPKAESNIPRGPAAMYGRPRPAFPSPPPEDNKPKPKGKRKMDDFLEEIKRNEAVREQRFGRSAQLEGSSVAAMAAWENEKGGKPAVPLESANLFITNLPANVTEDKLGLFFAEHGPVATVKIMWPRGGDEYGLQFARRGVLTGFVSYMNRRDAERAIKHLNDLEWAGNILKVTWGNSVERPAKALYDITTGRIKRSPSPRKGSRRERDRSRSRSISRERDVSSKRRQRRRSDSYSSYSSSSSHSPPPRRSVAQEKWTAKVDADTQKFLRTVAEKVRDRGRGFEDTLRDNEKSNPRFAFLSDQSLPEHHVYQFFLSSRYRFPTPPPDDFIDEGLAEMYSSDSAEESEKERIGKSKLGKLARRRLESMLRAMSGKRAEIARAMEFAINHAEAANEVAEIVCQSLKLDGTPVPRKMARLHLVSDILHNSGTPLPNVWKYRLAIEQRLPPVFAHLHTVYQSLKAYTSRISADVFRQQVFAVLDIWDRWMTFGHETNETLRSLLDGRTQLDRSPNDEDDVTPSAAPEAGSQKGESQPEAGRFTSGGFKSSFKPIAPAGGSDSPAAEDDVDGDAMEMDEDDVDGEPMEDLDGEPLAEEVDLDGEPIGDDDLDGEPM